MYRSCPTAGSSRASGPCQGQEPRGNSATWHPSSPKGQLETRTELTHFPTQGKEPAGVRAGRVGAWF